MPETLPAAASSRLPLVQPTPYLRPSSSKHSPGLSNMSSLQHINITVDPLLYLPHKIANPVSIVTSVLGKRCYSAMAGEYEEEDRNARELNFGIAAAFVSKDASFGEKSVWVYQGKDEKRKKREAGQDAFFVRGVGEGVAVGVADGVGGYAGTGIDSAEFSHALCENMADAAGSMELKNVTPGGLIDIGYRRILEEQTIAGGASTACVGVAKPDGTLDVANVGDSGYLILRQGKVHHFSTPQIHTFNTPFQLAITPKRSLQGTLGTPISDKPSDAILSSHRLCNGDVVIFATDGVWDNLINQDILRVVMNEMVAMKAWVIDAAGIVPGPRADLVGIEKKIARAVVAKAKVMSLSRVDGPFAKEVKKWFPGEIYRGGKRDDICVVCMICRAVEDK